MIVGCWIISSIIIILYHLGLYRTANSAIRSAGPENLAVLTFISGGNWYTEVDQVGF